MVGIITVLAAIPVLAIQPQQAINPTSSSIKSGVINLVVQVDGVSYDAVKGNNLTGVNFTYTNGSVEILIGSNTTNINNASESNWSLSLDTATLADVIGANYNFTFRLTNRTGTRYINQTSATSVRIDNTIPTVTMDEVAGTTFDETTPTITATTNFATGNSCIFRLGSNQYTGTHTGDNLCSLTISDDNPPNGEYLITASIDDGLNTSRSSPVSYTVRFSPGHQSGSIGEGQIATQIATNKVRSDKTFLFIIFAAFILWVGFNGKKKR